eukprot:7391977-Prymnesium_polylepis.2
MCWRPRASKVRLDRVEEGDEALRDVMPGAVEERAELDGATSELAPLAIERRRVARDALDAGRKRHVDNLGRECGRAPPIEVFRHVLAPDSAHAVGGLHHASVEERERLEVVSDPHVAVRFERARDDPLALPVAGALVNADVAVLVEGQLLLGGRRRAGHALRHGLVRITEGERVLEALCTEPLAAAHSAADAGRFGLHVTLQVEGVAKRHVAPRVGALVRRRGQELGKVGDDAIHALVVHQLCLPLASLCRRALHLAETIEDRDGDVVALLHRGDSAVVVCAVDAGAQDLAHDAHAFLA